MNKELIIVLDAGTGSGRAIIFNTKGKQIAIAQQEWDMPTLPKYPGSMSFDTKNNWKILCDCIKSAIKKADISSDRIIGVGATSMREGFVLYDRRGQEIWACPNIDARAEREVCELIKMNLGPEIYTRGGDWLGLSAASRLRWIKNNEPEVYERIAHITMISDWILYKLTGSFVTEPSIGSSSGLFNLSKRNWSKKTIEECELPRGIYPQIYESGTILGEVTAQAEKETGLKKGTPVVVCGADTQLALLGVGAINPFQYTLIGGSFWQTTVTTDKPLIDSHCRLRTLCHVIPDEWMTEGIGFLCGMVTRWFRDGFCQEEKRLAAEKHLDPYYILEKKAEKVPVGSGGIIGIFSNVMNAKYWKHAAPSFVQFDILSPETSGKKECFRAIEENAAYVTYGNLKNLVQLTNCRPKEITFCGGASKGRLWPQIISDVLNISLKIPLVKESTALGAAICTTKGIGVYSNFGQAVNEAVEWERIVTPNIENHKLYVEYYEKWRRVYSQFFEIVKDGLLQPMWAAPGT